MSGHDGGPEFPPTAALTLEGAADLLEAQLDELGVGDAHIVGNSMGGALALELAKRGRARSVVALAPGGGWNAGDGEAERLSRYFARQIRLTKRLERRLERLMRQAPFRHGALRDIMRHGELVSPADAMDMTRASMNCSIADRVISALASGEGVTVHGLERITCPVLLATPEYDRILPPALHAPRFRSEIPGVHPRVLLGCGHVPMWDDTPLVLNTILDFVRAPAEEPRSGGRERGRSIDPGSLGPRSAPGLPGCPQWSSAMHWSRPGRRSFWSPGCS